jgi:hypothetical protein
MDSFLVSQDSVSAQAENPESSPDVDGFTIYTGPNSGSIVVVKIYMPTDGELQTLVVSGDFISYKVELQDSAGSLPYTAETTDGVCSTMYHSQG